MNKYKQKIEALNNSNPNYKITKKENSSKRIKTEFNASIKSLDENEEWNYFFFIRKEKEKSWKTFSRKILSLNTAFSDKNRITDKNLEKLLLITEVIAKKLGCNKISIYEGRGNLKDLYNGMGYLANEKLTIYDFTKNLN